MYSSKTHKIAQWYTCIFMCFVYLKFICTIEQFCVFNEYILNYYILWYNYPVCVSDLKFLVDLLKTSFLGLFYNVIEAEIVFTFYSNKSHVIH